MDSDSVVSLSRDGIQLALLIGFPVLFTGIVVGVLVGVLQAVTQIQDQTVAFALKLLSMVVAFALFLPWSISKLVDFSKNLFENIPDSVTFFLQ